MPNDNPLNQLRDIHLPDPIGWWPLAPGWYLLMALAAFLIALICYKLFQHHLNNRAKRQALNLLADYRQHYQKTKDAQVISAQLSELLRRVALAYYPRSKVAGLKGEAWIHFLNTTATNLDFNPVKNLLLELPFQTQKKGSLNPLFTRTEAWIKQRGKPCSN